MLSDGFRHLFPAHSQRNAKPLVHIGINVHGYCAAQNQGVDNAPMNVAGQDDLIPPLAGSQDHALHRTCGTAHHQKRMGGAEGLRRQLFCLQNDGYWMAEVVERFHTVHVYTNALLAQKSSQFRVATTPLVAWNVKGNHPHLPKGFQRFVYGRTFLI